MREQFKPLSASDIEGTVCAFRHGQERYLGAAVQSEAMKYGTELHAIAHAVNKMRMKGEDPSVEQVKELIAKADIPLHLKSMNGGAEEAMLWWADLTHGSRPIDSEKIRMVEIAGRKTQFKPDCVRSTEVGVFIDDYKSWYIPHEEVARRTPRFMLYALATWKAYGYVPKSALWNLGQKYVVIIEWSEDELSRAEQYLQREFEKVIRLHDQLQDAPQDRWPGVIAAWEKSLNNWCDSCPVRQGCQPYQNLLLHGVFPEGTNLAHKVEILRMVGRVLKKAKDTLEDSLLGEVLEQGRLTEKEDSRGNKVPVYRLTYDDLEAFVKVEKREYKEMDRAAALRDVLRSGEREVIEKGKKKFAVRTLSLGAGLTITHQVNLEKESAEVEKGTSTLLQKLYIRKGGLEDEA